MTARQLSNYFQFRCDLSPILDVKHSSTSLEHTVNELKTSKQRDSQFSEGCCTPEQYIQVYRCLNGSIFDLKDTAIVRKYEVEVNREFLIMLFTDSDFNLSSSC